MFCWKILGPGTYVAGQCAMTYSKSVQEWPEECDKELKASTWPLPSPDPNPIDRSWDIRVPQRYPWSQMRTPWLRLGSDLLQHGHRTSRGVSCGVWHLCVGGSSFESCWGTSMSHKCLIRLGFGKLGVQVNALSSLSWSSGSILNSFCHAAWHWRVL